MEIRWGDRWEIWILACRKAIFGFVALVVASSPCARHRIDEESHNGWPSGSHTDHALMWEVISAGFWVDRV